MQLSVWLSVVGICLLGAMSPSPSVALVLHNTLNNGRRAGLITSCAHGLGIGLYAFLSVLGLAALITTSPLAYSAIQLAGAAYLIWLGIKSLRSAGLIPANTAVNASVTLAHAFRSGFLMAFLNPKAALFFVALFSQLVTPATPLTGKLGYAITAMLIDMSWYMCVTQLVSQPRWLARLKQGGRWFERTFGMVLLLVAAEILLHLGA